MNIAHAAARAGTCPAPLRVLVADDEPDILDLYSTALGPGRVPTELERLQADLFGDGPDQGARPDYELTLCSQGDAAVQAVEQSLASGKPYAVVFLDVRMPPGLDGVGAAERIRRMDPHVETVIVTGFSDQDPKEIARRVPPPEQLLYVRKPFHVEEVQHFASALTSKWRAGRALEQAHGELKARYRALKTAEERYQLAAQGANDGMWDWDLIAGRLHLSERWKAMLGYADHQIGSTLEAWLDRIHPDDIDQFRVELRAHLDGLTEHLVHEHRVLHADGTPRWVLCRGLAVRDEGGKAVRMAGSLTDVTERRRLEESLIHDAYHDALTGLANRTLFTDRLSTAVHRSQRHPGSQFAVLFLDLDRFKVINDSLGHAAGDQLLKAAASRCQGCLRAVDTLARLGGDEFTILLEDLRDVNDATRVADRILAALAAPCQLGEHEVRTSASIGIVVSDAAYHSAADMLRDADIAMYKAKSMGKARYAVFDAAMHTRVLARLELETDLAHAVERGELCVEYHPIVALGTGRIAGFEALVRWRHPQRGLLPPAEFIPLAEENGSILAIDLWVMREACRQMREWHRKHPRTPPLSISTNVSTRHFAQPGLAEHVQHILAETGLDSTTLRLEITEGAIMENFEAASQVLEKLHVLGVRVQVDDFGTGYSSLSYLHQLPLDTLKVDRSFVTRMSNQRNCREIVQTIVALAKSLNMELVAEGVETLEQMAELRAMQCQFGQGHLFYRPMLAAAVDATLSERLSLDVAA